MTIVGHRDVTFQRLVANALSRGPREIAVVDSDRTWTRAELSARVGGVADRLRTMGLGPGSRVALLSPNCAEYLVAFLGAVAAGCTYTGLHPLASLEDQHSALEMLHADLLVTGPGTYAERAHRLVGSGVVGRAVGIDGDSGFPDLVTGAVAPLRVSGATADDEASISFTGGTTGRPKGVVRSQRALAWSAMLMISEWDWPREVRFLATAPLTHATGAMTVPVLLRGGQIHVHQGFEVARVLEAIMHDRITSTFVVPTMLYRLLDAVELERTDLSSLQHVIYGAASANPTRVDEALDTFGPVLMQLYGQVEAPNTIAALRTIDHRPGDLARLASCGRPLAGLDVALLDPDGQAVQTGDPGEICVRGPLVMDGYLDNPEATAETLRGGWLHTGDVATADDEGFLTIVDRSKDMIVTGGFNVYPRQVEDVLAAHPSVAEVAVVGRADPEWGEAVTAFVVPVSGQTIDTEELRRLVRERRGPVHSPKAIEVIDAIPTTSLGKPDKNALRHR